MPKKEIDNHTSSVLTKKLSINRIIEIRKYGPAAQDRSELIAFLPHTNRVQGVYQNTRYIQGTQDRTCTSTGYIQDLVRSAAVRGDTIIRDTLRSAKRRALARVTSKELPPGCGFHWGSS